MDFTQVFTPDQVVTTTVALLVLVSGIVAVVYIIWWGFLIVISGGKEEKVKIAVNYIRHAALGAFFLVGALFVLPMALNAMGFTDYANWISPSTIFDRITTLSSQLFGGGTTSSSSITSPVDVNSSTFSDL